MASPPPENNGIGFVLSWGVVEWMITGIISAGSGVAIWVWGLGGRIDKLVLENERLHDTIERVELKTLKLEAELTLLKQQTEDRHLESAVAREKMRAELIERIAALPTGAFIENRLDAQTTRIDKLLAARLG